MNIVVCVKHVPNPDLPMVVDPETKRLVRNPAESVLDVADEYGIEIAIQLVNEHGGEVTAITMGPAAADDALRRALAMGVNKAIQITDDALAGSDAMATAGVLAAAIRRQNADLVICAVESTDAYTGMVPGAIAEMLDLPQVTFARKASIEGSTLTIERAIETGYQTIRAELPALMTVTASISEPRYPTFRGLMQAKRQPIEVLSIGDLDIGAHAVGDEGAHEQVLSIDTQTTEKVGVKIVDEDGDSVDQIVEFLKKIEIV